MRDEYRADFDEGRGGFGKQLLQKMERDTLRAQRHVVPAASGAATSGEAGEVPTAVGMTGAAPPAPAAVSGDSEMKPV